MVVGFGGVEKHEANVATRLGLHLVLILVTTCTNFGAISFVVIVVVVVVVVYEPTSELYRLSTMSRTTNSALVCWSCVQESDLQGKQTQRDAGDRGLLLKSGDAQQGFVFWRRLARRAKRRP